MPDPESPHDRMIREVGARQERMLRARADRNNVWSSMSMFGSVGWAVALPTILGVVAGVWIDSRWPGRFSWTLMLLVGGLLLGCLNAWLHISGGPQ
jgi:ATP synthase protein I